MKIKVYVTSVSETIIDGNYIILSETTDTLI